MKILLFSLAILSIICGLNAGCVKHHPNERCEERIFPEPEPREVHYIYHGESCACPKYHDTIVERPVVPKERNQNVNYKYDVVVPEEKKQDETRYLFDVRVERPIAKAPERPLSINYAVQVPQTIRQQDPTRYIYDTRVEQPVKPCNEKPWQGLVAQVDRVLMPSPGGCRNSEHTSETCDCGCQDASHTPGTCTCGNSGYALPIFYNQNSRYDSNARDSQISQVFTFPDAVTMPLTPESGSTKSKREIVPEKNLKSKRRERKSQKLRKISTKDLKSLLAVDSKKQRSSLKFPTVDIEQSRPKRRPGSPCGYTFESCDPKKHNRKGCPLCYKCRCEPSNGAAEASPFSPHDIRIPYKVVSHDDAPGMAATNQEFDYEPAAYTGLKDRDMYKKYIQQVVSKYPEHMSRRMPQVMDQERDLMRFISELSKGDKSPGDDIPTEDIRYKLVDNAMDMYKYYERAVSKLPQIQIGSKDGKGFKKRGTVLEVIEIDPKDFNESYKVANDDSEQEALENQ